MNIAGHLRNDLVMVGNHAGRHKFQSASLLLFKTVKCSLGEGVLNIKARSAELLWLVVICLFLLVSTSGMKAGQGEGGEGGEGEVSPILLIIIIFLLNKVSSDTSPSDGLGLVHVVHPYCTDDMSVPDCKTHFVL